MGVNVIQLTSKSHHHNLLASLHELRLQGQLSDVTVQVDNQGDVQEFQAHQVMLAASSGYFKKIILSKDATREKLLLSDVNLNCFSKFLEFVYTGKVEVARDEIGDVLAAAKYLDCEDLVEVCDDALNAGILQHPAKKVSAPELVGEDGLHGAKNEKGAKGMKWPKGLSLKRRLSPQSSEKEVVSKICKKRGRKLKVNLAARKVLQRRLNSKKEDLASENKTSTDEAEEDKDRGEAQAQPEDQAEKGDKPSLGTPDSDTHDGDSDEDEQLSDDAEDMLLLTLSEEEQKKRKQRTSSKAQFQCNKCQRTFHYERSYLKHISTYHGLKADVVYRCETCLQTFANRSNLKIHERHVHSSERLFSCASCTKAFKRKKDVVRHQRQVHERNKRHVCQECGKTLSSRTALLLHERTHTGAKPYECADCAAKFTQNSALKMHRRTHTGEKPFACDECEARFTQKHMLTYHKRSHTGEKPFMCEDCGKSFASKEYLRHHSNIHTGSRPYKCDVCGRGFAQRNSLHQHLKVHTGERPYSCKDCDKHFTQLNALQRHQRIHTGEKPYMCSLCGRTFTDKSTLRRHAKIHDSDIPWKTYLVVLEGNVEDKKPKTPSKGKTENAEKGEKKAAARKSAGTGARGTDAGDTDATGAAVKTHLNSIVVPAEPVTIPSEWTSHGGIALVSHGAGGGITVIHTEVPPGTQLQPIVTTDGAGTSVISLEGSAIPVPFTVPVSVSQPMALSSEAPALSLSVPTFSVPVTDGTFMPVSEVPIASAASILEAAASQTSLVSISDAEEISQKDLFQTVIVG